MATQWDWITDSTPNYTPPPAPQLTTAPTLPALTIPPAQTVPQPSAIGTPMPNGFMVEPYIYPLPPAATYTAAGPSMPIPPGPPSQPTPPPSGAIVAPGPQTPPMGPFGPGVLGISLSVITASLPNGTVDAAYTATLAGYGGKPPYTWAATPLPDGLTLSGATISGDPTTAGTTQVVVTVTDAMTPANTATETIPLVVA